MRRLCKNVLFALALSSAAVSLPGTAAASHGGPDDYGIPLFERIAASPDWEDWTGLVRPTLFLLSDLAEAAKHGFGLWDRSASASATASAGRGSNVLRDAETRPIAPPATTGGGGAAGATGAGTARD